MATPVWACGLECGVDSHLVLSDASFSTTTVRSGARSLRVNPTAGSAAAIMPAGVLSGAVKVFRFYRRWATLPSADCFVGYSSAAANAGAWFKQSDSKIYAADGTTLGATGVAVTTGQWYRIDVRVNSTSNPWLVDVQVDGVACGQASLSRAADTGAFQLVFGDTVNSRTEDGFTDDILASTTSGDYPLGAGYIISYIPNADGAHNVAGAADFRKNAGGADITNATTDAFDLVNDRPLKSGAPDTEFINLLAPPNATDYVELAFENSAESAGPRSIEVIAKVAQAGTGAGNMELRLNDNGSMGTIYTATGVAGIVNGKYVRAHFADPPSAASAWNIANDGGNGDFQDIRVRFGSPAAVDANPDQYLVSIMIEAEYADAGVALAPSAVAIPLVVRIPQVAVNTIVAPSAQTIPLAIAAPTLTKTKTQTPSPVAVPMSVATPTISRQQILSPTPRTIPLSVLAPAISISQNVSPTPVTIPLVVPAPEIDTGALPTIDSVTPDTFEDTDTGIVIVGANFGNGP